MRKVHIAIAAALALTAFTVPILLADQHPAGLIAVLPSDLRWEASPTIPGAQTAMIEGDLNAAVPFTMRLKYPPNFKLAVHTHPIPERLTVISGTYHMGIGDKFDRANARAYPAGSVVIIPAGMPMFVYTTEETILQLHGIGPWEVKYLTPADNPFKK